MNDGAKMVAVVPMGAYGIHHLRIAHTDDIGAYLRTDTVTCYLLDIAHLTAIGSFIWEGIAQGSAYGVGGEMLYMSGEV